MTLKGLVLGLLSIVAMSIGVGTAEAGFPGGNGPIVFTSVRGGSTDIYTMQANGSGVTRLTNTGTNTSPAWSQDRTRIAFISKRDGNPELYVMDADGDNQTRLTTTTAAESDPAFSPDNDKIAYASNAGGDRELYVMTLGDEPVSNQITANTTQDYAPDFSPDGSTLVYEHYAPGTDPGKGYQIFKIPVQGGTPVNLTGTAYNVENADPAFNGDGSRIVFQSRNRPGHTNWEIYTMNADGSNQVKRTNVPSAANTAPVYSPSGTNGALDQGTPEKILFVSNRTGSDQVFVMNANGSGQTQVSDGAAADNEPNWQALDIFPPDTTIVDGPEEGSTVAADNADFSFESSEAGSTFECRLDQHPSEGTWGSCDANHNTGAIDDGTYTLKVRAIDPSGNVDPTPAERTFTIDTTAPVVDLADGPRGAWEGAFINFTDPLFEYSSPEDSETNLITFECRIDPVADDPETEEDDATPWSDCTTDGSLQAQDLTEGTHLFQVRGTDPWGNTSAPVEANFEVDLTEPVASITAGPADGFWLNNGEPSYEFDSDEPGTFECRISDSPESDWAACTSPFAPASALGDGPHTFEVRAIDRALNVQSGPAARVVNVDTVNPVTTVTSGPDNETIDVDHASFSFESDQPEDATFECNFNGNGWEACTSPFATGVIDNDDYTFEVRSTDRAGNTGAPAALREFTVYAPPRTVITSGPADGAHIPTGNASFDFTSEGANVSEDTPTFQCRIDSTDDNDWEACTSPLNVNGLNNGAHSVQVRAIGEGNRPDLTPATRNFTVDKVHPDTTIVSGPEEGSLTNDPTFEFGSTEDGTFECSINGGAWEACESGVALVVDDGPVNLQVRAVDLAGNEDLTPATRSFTLDATAPDTTIDSGPADGSRTKSTEITFAFSSSEPTDATFECQVDDGDWASCVTPFTTDTLADGAHTFKVRATDMAGNTDASAAAVTFTVDTVAPVATITTADPAEGVATKVNQPAFEFESDKAGSVFVCRFNQVGEDEADWESCSSPAQPGSALADGDYQFQVRAIDDVGNQQDDPTSRSFTVDTTAPTTSIDSGPAEGSTIEVDHASFDFSSSEEGSTFECSLTATGDPDDFATCESPLDSGSLTDGDYTFKVQATDPAGNTDTTGATVNFSVDSPPTASILGSSTVVDGGRTNSTTPSFDFESNENDSTFECRVDSTADDDWAACASGFTAPALGDGPHTFEVRAVDPADRAGAIAKASFAVDTGMPVVDFTGGPEDGAYIATDSPEFSFTSSKEGSTFECKLDGGSYAACDSPEGLSGLAEGPHAFSVKATDDVGNESNPATVNFTVDLTAPVSTIDVPSQDQAFDTNQPEMEFSADETATFECQVDGGDWVDCESPYETDVLDDGSHTFSVRATDRAGNVEVAPVTVDFTTDAPPRVDITSGIEDGAYTNQQEQSFEFTATENDATFECRIDSEEESDWTSCSSPATFSNLAEGSHKVGFRAVEAASPNRPSLKPVYRTFTVDITNPTSSFNSGPADGATIATDSATFAFDSNEPGTFECKADETDWIACDSPVTLTDLDDGSHTFSVRATDLAGNVQAPVSSRGFTVDTTAPVTTITSGPEAGAAISNTTPSFAFEADEAATFECKVDGGSWDNCTSPFTTGALTAGSHTVEIRATDTAGNVETAPVSRSFSVDTQAPTVNITSGPAGLTNDSTPSFAFEASESSTFQCKVDDGTFASCSSPYTTSSLADGAHTVKVMATDAAGNDSAVASREFTVDTTPPSVTITSGPEAKITATTATIEFSGSEDGSTFECSFDGGSFAACTSPQSYSGLTLGDHSVAVRATDRAGNQGEAAKVEFTVVEAPVANLAKVVVKGPKKVKRGKKFALKASVKNQGSAASGKVKVCVRTPKKLIAGKAKRCRTISSVGAGKTKTVTFKLRAKKAAKGAKAVRAKIKVSAPTGKGATSGKRVYKPLLFG
ncbi:MAG: PD40 domain-containing protein [Solirubrobacterales bacterium]|nr:PD40 domain-containing protein [Solirubrobacterales bacterium]